jgi:hypothetical protein
VKITSILLLTIVCVLIAHLNLAGAQERTMGLLIHEDGTFEGYALFNAMLYNTTYLINKDGLLINSWESEYQRGFSTYLKENGNLLRHALINSNGEFPLGGQAGLIQELDWEGTVVWEFIYASDEYHSHHDFEYLPNGNVLLVAWEYKSREEAIQEGRDPELIPATDKLFPDHIVEVEPDGQTGGNIVWEWHIWDHLIQDFDSTKSNYGIIADHPELMDINAIRNVNVDWNHTNSIDYNVELDQIILSFLPQSEIVVIDHSTTTEEAAGHSGGLYGKGGDFLYRWGNPMRYDAGTIDDKKLFNQHDASWIEPGCPGEGNILFYHNGRNRPDGNYSSINEIEPPIDEDGNYQLEPGSAFGPDELFWTYVDDPPAIFYSQNLSGAQRLPNGNTIICSGRGGEFREVTQNNEVVWLYINPVGEYGPMMQGDSAVGNNVFKISHYSTDFPGFEGRDMTPGDPIERYPTDVAEGIVGIPDILAIFPNYPNPFNATTSIKYNLPDPADVIIEIFDILGCKVETLIQGEQQAGYHQITWDASGHSSGMYFYRIQAGEYAEARKMLLLK